MQNRLLIATLIAMATAAIVHVILKRRVDKQKLRQAYRNGAASVALLAVLMVLAEIGTRIIYPEIDAGRQAPAFIKQFSNEPVSEDTNRFGYRERDFDVVPPEGTVRIAVLGDSITAGHGLPVQDRLTNKLEERLNLAGKTYEVLNFGIYGHETVDHHKTLKKILGSMHPDFILVQWFFNDLESHGTGGRPKYYRLVPSARIRLALERNSVLYAMVRKAWRELQVSLGLVDPYWDYMADHFKDPNGEEFLKAMTELEELFRLAKAAKVPIGMVLYPEATVGQAADSPAGFLLERVLDGCARNQIICVDLRPLFDGRMAQDQITQDVLDPHPTALVHEMAIPLLLEDFGTAWQDLRPKGFEMPVQSARRGATR